jgi:hypothetical protein
MASPGGGLGSRTIKPGVPRVMRRLSLAVLVLLLAACQSGPTDRPVPSVAQIGGDLKCATGDHGFADAQAGWGFCYPATWRYNEKSQASSAPPGLDLTFDITDIPCVEASAAPGSPTVAPVCSPNAGLFAFMIVSTYERGDAVSLSAWIQANMSTAGTLQPIAWGNAVEAGRLADGRRIALTPHHVVVLDLRSASGNLDLEGLMSSRLDTWKFTY